MSGWQVNLGLGTWVRGYAGVTVDRTGGELANLAIELSPGFVGSADSRAGPGDGHIVTYGSIELAPVLFVGQRATRGGRDTMLAVGGLLQVRAPIAMVRGASVIHPVAPYFSVGMVTHDDVAVTGVDLRLSVGADFAIAENASGALGLNANASMVSDDEFTFSLGVSGHFDLFGGLRTLSL